MVKPLLLAMAVVLFSCRAAGAQDAARTVNPEAVEFDSPVLHQPGLTGLRVDVFRAYTDPALDTPVKSFDVSLGSIAGDGRVRVALSDALLDVPNGRYIATIRGLGPTPTEVSTASDVFVLSRPGAPEDRVADAKREKRWTRIGIAIGGGLLLLPFLLR